MAPRLDMQYLRLTSGVDAAPVRPERCASNPLLIGDEMLVLGHPRQQVATPDALEDLAVVAPIVAPVG